MTTDVTKETTSSNIMKANVPDAASNKETLSSAVGTEEGVTTVLDKNKRKRPKGKAAVITDETYREALIAEKLKTIKAERKPKAQRSKI